jgi:hypothetical protein
VSQILWDPRRPCYSTSSLLLHGGFAAGMGFGLVWGLCAPSVEDLLPVADDFGVSAKSAGSGRRVVLLFILVVIRSQRLKLPCLST